MARPAANRAQEPDKGNGAAATNSTSDQVATICEDPDSAKDGSRAESIMPRRSAKHNALAAHPQAAGGSGNPPAEDGAPPKGKPWACEAAAEATEPVRASGFPKAELEGFPKPPQATEHREQQRNFTRQARGDHSTAGNREDGDGAPKRKP